MSSYVHARRLIARFLPGSARRHLLKRRTRFRQWRRLRRADVVLISFAKSGRTWLRSMIVRAITDHYGIAGDNVLVLDELPRQVSAVPVIVETHDRGNVRALPGDVRGSRSRYRRKKVVFLCRDPRDIVVSAYFQATKRKRVFAGTIREYLYHPVGSLDTILQYFNAWARQRGVPKGFILVKYEDLHTDPHGELRRILDFVGLRDVSEEAIEEAVDFTSFANMRRLERDGAVSGSMVLRPGDPSDQESYKTRRGKVGGFVDYFDTDDIEYMNRRIERELDPFFGYGDVPSHHDDGAGVSHSNGRILSGKR